MAVEPIAIIGAFKGLIDLFKSLRGVAKEIKSAELNEKLTQAQTAMLDLQGMLSEFVNQNAALEEENKNLKAHIAFKERLVFNEASSDYWIDGDSGREGPFCSRCFDADKKVIRLRRGRLSKFLPGM